MSRSIQVVSGCSSSLRSVHCYGRFTLGIRLGLFPLGLRTPCSLVPPYPRTPSLRVGSSGRLLFGGRKASFPQLGLLLVPSESALRTTPFLVFISVVVKCFSFSAFDWGGVRPSAWTLLAETARGGCKCLPQVRSKTSGLLPPVRACEDSLFRFLNTRPLFLFCRLVLSFPLFRAPRDSALPLHRRRAGVSPLRRW